MTFDLSSLATPPTAEPRIFRGFIAEDAVDPNQFIEVRIPAYNASRTFGPCSFMPRPLRDGSLMYPIRNDPCLVAIDENEQADLINWWAEDPTVNQTYTARLIALEAINSGSRLSALELLQPSVVTSLPATPYDGQEVYYRFSQSVVPADAKVLQWHFRWDASDGAWLPVGRQEPVYAYAPSADSTAFSANTWGGISANDPAVTAPRAGEYDVEWGCGQLWANASANWYVAAWFAGSEQTPNGTPPTADIATAEAGSTWSGLSASKKLTMTAAQQIRHRYYIMAAATLNRSTAYIKLYPRRVTG